MDPNRASVPLRELDIVIPAVGHTFEAVSLRYNVEKDEQVLLNADLLWHRRVGMFHHPVGELYESDLIHVGELVEALWYAVEQIARSRRTSCTHDGHVEISRCEGWQTEIVLCFVFGG